MHLGILTSHPIQYQAPWFRALAKEVDLEVFFAHRQTAAEQGSAGFGVAFDWDVDLLSGYQHRFLNNVSRNPGVNHFAGCDTPEIAEIIRQKIEDRRWKIDTGQKIEAGNSTPSPISNLQSSREARFDVFIVTGWYLKSYLQAVRACRAAGVPVLVRGDSQLGTPRSLLKRVAMEIRQRWLLRHFDAFLSVGQRHREYLEHFGVPSKKIFFAPHFVDNEWFAARAAEVRANAILAQRVSFSASDGEKVAKPDEVFPGSGEGQGVRALGEVSNPSPNSQLLTPISALREQWGADDETLVALFVGKFISKKRPGDLLQAIAKMKGTLALTPALSPGERENVNAPLVKPSRADSSQRGERALPLLGERVGVRADQESNFLAVFVGSGELEPALRAQTTSLGVRASFVGFKNQTELPALYAAADVLVLPSESETWGLVVNEAMACGLPAVVSDAVGCAPDLIEEGRTGFTFPVGDVKAFSEKLQQMAVMRNRGEDFRPALAEKMRAYSVEAAVRGTIKAAEKLAQ